MPQGKHNVLCFDFLSILQENRLHAVILPLKACHLGEEAHLTAQRNDFFPKLLYHAAQQICPDMRLGIIKNFLGRACVHHFLQNLAATGVFDARSQLAIGKGTCAALAKLHVAFHIQLACLPKGIDRLLAAVHITATLQYNGLQAHFRQKQGSKHARRPEANHNGTL